MIGILIAEIKMDPEKPNFSKEGLKRKGNKEETEIQWWRLMRWIQDNKTFDSLRRYKLMIA